MLSPPLKTGITWLPRLPRTPPPRCSPSRSPRPNVAPQKPRLSRMENPQHRKSLGVNDQRFPFLVHTKDFIFVICFSHLLPELGFFCRGSDAFFPTGRSEASVFAFMTVFFSRKKPKSLPLHSVQSSHQFFFSSTSSTVISNCFDELWTMQ